jgi:hypothetical protein
MGTSKVLHYVLAGILVLIFIIGLVTRSAVKKYSGLDSKRAEKLMKDYQKVAEDVAKDYQEAAEEMTKELGKARIQLGNGEIIPEADKSAIQDALGQMGDVASSFTLLKGTNFVKVNLTDDGYTVEYREGTSYGKSEKNDLSEEDVEDLLIDFLKGDKKWKKAIDWE